MLLWLVVVFGGYLRASVPGVSHEILPPHSPRGLFNVTFSALRLFAYALDTVHQEN